MISSAARTGPATTRAGPNPCSCAAGANETRPHEFEHVAAARHPGSPLEQQHRALPFLAQQAIPDSPPPDWEASAATAGQNASSASNRQATLRTQSAKPRPNLPHYTHAARRRVNSSMGVEERDIANRAATKPYAMLVGN
jgi:hypothetical protein